MGCPCCGKEVVQTEKKRKKVFCDSTCRSNYWQTEKRKVKPSYKPYEKKVAISNTIEKTIPVMPPGLTASQQIQWKLDNVILKKGPDENPGRY